MAGWDRERERGERPKQAATEAHNQQHRLATATARLLRGSGYLPTAVVDEVELLLDAAEAIWASGRCVV